MLEDSHVWMCEIACLYMVCFYPEKVRVVVFIGVRRSSISTVPKNHMVQHIHNWEIPQDSVVTVEQFRWGSWELGILLEAPTTVVRWKPTNHKFLLGLHCLVTTRLQTQLCEREKCSQHNLHFFLGMWYQGFDRSAMLLSHILSLFDRPSLHRGTSNEPITSVLLIILDDDMKCYPPHAPLLFNRLSPLGDLPSIPSLPPIMCLSLLMYWCITSNSF